jgi:NADPH:quinone reductase
MRAIEVPKTGPPEVLTLVDLRVPRPKANEVLVKIAASGVNFADVYYREGRAIWRLPELPADVLGRIASTRVRAWLAGPSVPSACTEA